MITVAYTSPYLTRPLRSKLAVAAQYGRWACQAGMAAQLAAQSGNWSTAAELAERGAEYTRLAAMLTEELKLDDIGQFLKELT